MQRFRTLSLTARIVWFVVLAGPAAGLDRSEIPEKETWDLSVLYPSEEAWLAAKEAVAQKIASVDQYRGKLGSSAGTLLAALETVYEIRKAFARLHAYAAQASDLDMRNEKAMERRQSLDPLFAQSAARVAWLKPEILALDSERVQAFYSEEPRLVSYRPVIHDILRMKDHTLSPVEEKILADAGLLSGTPGGVYSLLKNAEFPRATVTLSTGETVRLDDAAYTYHRAAPNRWDRELVFQAFFGKYREFSGTFGALLNGEIRNHFFRARARRYPDCLAAALDGSNVPVAVYHTLIRNVRRNLPTLWRYLRLRQRIMGLDDLRYSDLYAAIYGDVTKTYTLAEATELVLNGVAPLGDTYVTILRNGFENRWVDWHPSRGKRSGAYSSGDAYDVHPFILMNFTGTYEEVSTVAHEAGHAMHSYFSNHTQPYATSDYTNFVAEVASTCNEHLLMDYMLKHTEDDRMKLALLGSYLETFRTTLFRQALFAEFELSLHRMVEAGQALTGEKLTRTYGELLSAYYGQKDGITAINPVCHNEWAYVPHFYYNFYVYTYATSLTASTAISRKILKNEPDAVKNFLTFLSLGDSLPPVEELKVAGVDMTTDRPFAVTMQAMNQIMDDMEAVLDRLK